jgi:hypothetical protein
VKSGYPTTETTLSTGCIAGSQKIETLFRVCKDQSILYILNGYYSHNGEAWRYGQDPSNLYVTMNRAQYETAYCTNPEGLVR